MYNSSMHAPYESTANKLRPQSFAELTGQDFVINTLLGSLNTAQGAHAYLFSGPRGVGKTSAARLLALALNRPSGSDTSQLHYDGSDDIRHGRSLDVIEIDGASYTSVENIRSIRDEIRYKPVQFLYKVYIIDEVHMLSNSAFNALLKTIEEPPEYVVFIFATTELHKVPATIRSRCQQFAFKRISIQNIVDKLSELCTAQKISAENDALIWIAKEADGSMRDAYMLFDQVCAFSGQSVTLEGIKKHIGLIGMSALNGLFLHCVRGEKKEALSFIDTLYASGVSSEHIVLEASEYVRNILFIKAGIASTSLLGYGLSQFDAAVHESLTSVQIERALSLLLECYRNIRYTTNQRFEVELAFALLCELSRYVSPTELVERLEDLQNAPLPHALAQDQDAEKIDSAHGVSKVAESPVENTDESVDDAMWTKVLDVLAKQDERLLVILDSVRIQKDEAVLHCAFSDAFAFSTFQKEQEKITHAVKQIYGEDFAVEAVLQEAPALGSGKNKARQLPQERAHANADESDKEAYSEDIKSVLNIFGGSVKAHE